MPHHAPLLPSDHLQGRFAPAQELPGGWYQQANSSGVLYPDMAPRLAEDGLLYDPSKTLRRDSFDSTYSTDSTHFSVATPRRVESIIDLNDAVAYHVRQAQQRPAGGAYFEGAADAERVAQALQNVPRVARDGYPESIHSFASDSSVSLHFSIPPRTAGNDNSNHGDSTAPPVQVPTTQPSTPAAQQQTASYPPTRSTLTAPTPSLRPTNRFSASRRPQSTNGRSPLARKSFTRLATDTASPPAENIEMPERRVSRRHSVAGTGSHNDERRGRRWSTSVDARGRRRLSKQRPSLESERGAGGGRWRGKGRRAESK